MIAKPAHPPARDTPQVLSLGTLRGAARVVVCAGTNAQVGQQETVPGMKRCVCCPLAQRVRHAPSRAHAGWTE